MTAYPPLLAAVARAYAVKCSQNDGEGRIR